LRINPLDAETFMPCVENVAGGRRKNTKVGTVHN